VCVCVCVCVPLSPHPLHLYIISRFHYLHHANFECNYGTNGAPLDKWFGTFRERLGRSVEYRGQATSTPTPTTTTTTPTTTSSSSSRATTASVYLRGSLHPLYAIPSSWAQCVYNIYTAYLAVFVVVVCTGHVSADSVVFSWFSVLVGKVCNVSG